MVKAMGRILGAQCCAESNGELAWPLLRKLTRQSAAKLGLYGFAFKEKNHRQGAKKPRTEKG
jgi:hypothetical protein